MYYLYTWNSIKEKSPKFEGYLEELMRARKVFNLSGARDDNDFIRLIEESLAPLMVIKDWENKYVIDIGSGAGFPGIPLAIMEEEARFLLLDSSYKRTTFLKLVKLKLRLDNVEVVYGDASRLASDDNYRERFDIAITRGLGKNDLGRKVAMSFLKRGGRYLTFKNEGPGYPIKPGLVILEEMRDD
ncbi:MAG: 16S rRNA (guanine(527)-N(7))-methyltransferase RsmG [bacterium]